MKPLLTDTWAFIYFPWKEYKYYLKLYIFMVMSATIKVVNKAPSLMVTLGLNIAVLDIFLI